MWSPDETQPYALASLSPTKWQPTHRLSMASFSTLDCSFGSESNVSLVPPSPLVKFARRWLDSSSVTSRLVNLIRIDGGKNHATVANKDFAKSWNYEVDYPPIHIVNTIISTLEVSGILSLPLMEMISRAKRVDAIKFRLCTFKCSASEFAAMIRSVLASSLMFVGCEFLDARIISDKLFAVNKQINKVVIRPANKEMFSFPYLTNGTLLIWKHTVPAQIQFTNVLTSFTAKAISDISQVFSNKKLFKWHVGTVSTDVFGMGEMFSQLPASHVKEVVIISPKVHVLYKNKSVIVFSCSSMELLCAHRFV